MSSLLVWSMCLIMNQVAWQWNANASIIDVVMGKVEGQGESWHGHVTAVTVAPEYRRQQLAKKLMNLLEEISDNV